ncbi:MAG: ribonuclease HI family protein [Patescibacteria group bacterium]
MKLIIHTDGGARGNPGPAAIGVVIEEEKERKKIAEFGKKIGETTNNVAEYTAVIEALRRIKSMEVSEIDFFLDSVLVVNQLNGTFKVKNMKLRELLMQVRTLEEENGGVIRYRAIPREKNRRADFLVNRALDTI